MRRPSPHYPLRVRWSLLLPRKTRNRAKRQSVSSQWFAKFSLVPFFCTRSEDRIIYLSGGTLMSDPRYPIGKFSYSAPLNTQQKNDCLSDIEQTPARLQAVLKG